MYVNWEDPFQVQAGKLPDLWIPGRKLPPVDLEAIRERQQPLLKPIREWIEAADQAVRRIENMPGGQLHVVTARKDVVVEVLYRLPDHPTILQSYGPIAMSSVSIPFSTKRKTGIPIFDRLFPVQMYIDPRAAIAPSPPDTPDRRAAIAAAEKELGVARSVGLSTGDDLPPERLVVYPTVLRFIDNWIANMITPLTDIRFAELPAGETNIRSGTRSVPSRITEAAKAPRPH